MGHRFLMMPASWDGAGEHVARPLNDDYRGKVPWVALVREEAGAVTWVRRSEAGGAEGIRRAAAEARAWHQERKMKWRVTEKTWGFFGLFSRPTLLEADGEYDFSRMGGVKDAPRYGLTMTVAGATVPDDGAPELLFTPAMTESAKALLREELVYFAMPKRGMAFAVPFHPFKMVDFAKGLESIFERAGAMAVTPHLFSIGERAGKRTITLMIPQADGVLLNAADDDDAGFLAP